MHILTLILAAYYGLNGMVMLVTPRIWYALVPGVVDTGPYNAHFVRDIGLAFLAAALALVLASRSRSPGLALWPAAVFLGGHALLHAVEMVVHAAAAGVVVRDLVLIVIPGLAPLLLALQPAWREGRT